MLILPAIDLRDGHCVRLRQGRADEETVYSGDPTRVASDFVAHGARALHLVDLDGAFTGASRNLASIRAIRATVDIPLELGGGIRSLEQIQAVLDLGIESVIVGTMAVRDPELFQKALDTYGGDRLQLGIDARDGKVAVQGWEEETSEDAIAFGKKWASHGVQRIIFTDIAKDGMLEGPNVEAIRHFAEGTGLKVTASGGVTRPEDVEALRKLEGIGVDRVIIGKALYEGRIHLEELKQ